MIEGLSEGSPNLFKYEIYAWNSYYNTSVEGDKEWHLITSGVKSLYWRQYMSNQNGNINVTSEGVNLNWQPYEGIDFQNYIIEREYKPQTIELESTTYSDSEFVGEAENCTVHVKTVFGEKKGWAVFKTEKDLPFYYLAEVDDRLAIMWNTTKFSGKIKGYKLKLHEFENGQWYWNEIATNNSQENYIIIDDKRDFVFGKSYEFALQVIPNYEYKPENANRYSKYKDVKYGAPGLYFDDVVQNGEAGFIYEGSNSLDYYDVVKSWGTRILYLLNNERYCISSDLNYIAVYEAYNKSDQVKLYSTHNAELIKTVTIDDLPEGWMNFTDISNNGVFTVGIQGHFIVYNLLNDKLIASEQEGFGNISDVFASPNNKYILKFASDLTIYELVNDELNVINTVPLSGQINGWHKNNQDEETFMVLDIYEQKLYFKSYKDLATVNSFEILTHRLMSFDHASQRILTYKNNTFYIYDYNSGELLKELPTELYVTENNTVFNQNTIFATDKLKYRFFD